jgi:hypothetical protein
MSKIEIIQCNNCNKQTKDIHDEMGWVIFEGVSDFCVTGSRKKDGSGEALRYFPLDARDEVHLCSPKCLIDFFYINDNYWARGDSLQLLLELTEENERVKNIMKLVNKAKEMLK